MRRLLISALLVLSYLAGETAVSQEPPYKVTLKGFETTGGMINASEGELHVLHSSKGSTEPGVLETGDAVTIANGYAEILLNPGYYLRLGNRTSIEFLDLSPDNLKLKLLSGSAIIEISMTEGQRMFFSDHYFPENTYGPIYEPVTIDTPDGEIALVQGGLYRLDVSTNTNIRVTKGEAISSGTIIREGATSRLTKGKIEKGLARLTEDGFDDWSHARSLLQLAANKSLRNTTWHKHLRKYPLSYFQIDDDETHLRRQEKYEVSAIGGYVRFEEGGLFRQRGSEDWVRLTQNDELTFGDRLKTTRDTRAEVLMYTACYLHLGSDTEIIYGKRDDGGASIAVLQGSVILTSLLLGKDKPIISLRGNGFEFGLNEDGLYRLNVPSLHVTELLVRDGSVQFGSRKIQKGTKTVFDDSSVAVSKVDKKNLDSLDVWSRKRVAPMERGGRISGLLFRVDGPRDPGNWEPLIAYFRIHRAELSGLWYRDETLGGYTYVPGAWDFRSPYGGKYEVRFSGRGRR